MKEIDVEVDKLCNDTKNNSDNIKTLEKEQIQTVINKINQLEKAINNNTVMQTMVVRETSAEVFTNITNFKQYKRNFIQFLNRFDEYLKQIGENK